MVGVAEAVEEEEDVGIWFCGGIGGGGGDCEGLGGLIGGEVGGARGAVWHVDGVWWGGDSGGRRRGKEGEGYCQVW